jgi:fatty-acyl-CoA synthase
MSATNAAASAPPTTFHSHVELIIGRADAEPDRVIISDDSQALTTAQFRRGVENAALDLINRGLDRGAVVALAAPISVEAVTVRYAAGLLGCATVVCPNAADPARLDRFLAAAGADHLIRFAEAEFAPTMIAADHVYVITDVDFDTEPVRLALDATTAPAVDPDALAVLVTSGGTTGEPKISRRSFIEWRHALAGPPGADRRQLICTPLPYIAQILLDQTLLGGGAIVLRDRFDPALVLQAIEADRITHLCLVEPRLVDLADHPEALTRDLSSLVAISHIGADAAPSLRRRLLGRLGARLAHPYGASDSGLVSVLGPNEYRPDAGAALGSAGPLLPGVEVRIEAPDGAEVAAGSPGRIVVRSSGTAHDYAAGRDPQSFRAGGWFVTGDCGFLDADGRLHVRGRLVDERHVAGRAVYPVDVQDQLCALPGVAYAVAIPAIAQSGFDAAVLALPGSTLSSTLADALAADLGLHRLVVIDHIPVTEQGKPDHIALEAMFATR